MNSRLLSVRVTGDLALFTRPENKTERVSYPAMTPSAARGILEAVYWRPEFRYQIREIHVLAQPQYFGILRNEVNTKMAASRTEPYFADDDRTQRYSLCLRDVDYAIFADVQVKEGVNDDHAKYRDQFRRRVAKGQCFHRPALGCREFAAEFGPLDDSVQPCDWSEDLGLMLWDIQYPPKASKAPHVPLFFHARVEGGVIAVPPHPLGAAR